VLIPARLASSRLPNKPLADIHGLPMVVRVAQQATRSQAKQVVVACDHIDILNACLSHGVQAVLTRTDHASGSDRLAQACDILGLSDTETVVNVQGDEPMIDPGLIDAVADQLARHPACSMGTAAHPIHALDDFLSPHVVKVVMDAQQCALYFSRAPMPFWRDGNTTGINQLPVPAPLRHIGLYAYRVGFLRKFPQLPPSPLEVLEALEQLRAMWHGYRIAVHVTPHAPGAGVDTPADLERVRNALSGSR
jgi:3-deoxy-manno-octulosonate cytidylyltransferase (CMP-KDO synthetase)